MLNRDSLTLKVLLLLSVVLGVLASITDPTLYGLKPVFGAVLLNYIKLASVIVAAVTGWLQTSPLPGENDDKRVNGGMRSVLLPFLLVSALASGACLPKNPPAVVNPQPSAEQVQAVRNQAEKLAVAVREAWALAIQAGRLADQAYAAGIIPAATMQKINQAGIDAANRSEVFETFARTVTTEPSLKVTARELLKVFDDYILALSEGKQSGDTIRAALAALRAYLGVQ